MLFFVCVFVVELVVGLISSVDECVLVDVVCGFSVMFGVLCKGWYGE